MQILEAFAQPLKHDIRQESDSFRPVFRRGAATSLDALVPGGISSYELFSMIFVVIDEN